MSFVTTLDCDGKNCETLKRQANKWWIVFEHQGAVIVTTEELLCAAPPSFAPLAAACGQDDGFTRYDACSEACLHTILGGWTRQAYSPEVVELEREA